MTVYSQLDTVLPSVSPEAFFAQYIAQRTPVIIQGFPDDEEFRLQRWVSLSSLRLVVFQRVTASTSSKTDLNYLKSKAGRSQVLVEPIHLATQQFGTDVERLPMNFGDFVGSLEGEGPTLYLTTQYAEQDLDALTVLPPPTDALSGDFPRVPRLMGHLFLQQVNLWLGKSKGGTTSGLVRGLR